MNTGLTTDLYLLSGILVLGLGGCVDFFGDTVDANSV